jgi:Ca2+-binding RTX toxin-like protein
MANYTYSFEGGDQGSLDTVLSRYTGEFRAAVQNAIGSLIPDSDPDDEEFNIDFQPMDQDGEDFDTEGYGGAYVLEGTGFANLDEAPVILFDDTASDGDGVSVTLNGETEQFVGMTTLGDKLVIVADDDNAGVVVDGYKGNDTITTGRGDDIVLGGDGDDRISAGKGDDEVHGNDGDDRINGGAGDDVIDGGDGNDTLFGDSGDDEIYGGEGDDSIYGGVGDTTVNGGSGFDVAILKGNAANFTFEDGAWTDGGSTIEDVEYTKLDNGVLITVDSDEHADVARLFQMLTDKDPTALELRNALDLFDSSGDLAEVAAQIDTDGSLGLDEYTSSAAEIKGFVATLVNNAFDDDPWTNDELNDYVDDFIAANGGSEVIEKKFIAADLVTKLIDADEHIHIAINS